jgi:hypothetical protein
MAGIMNTSIMSSLGQLVQVGQDTFKAARNAVRGLGQDGKFFDSSKRGACTRGRQIGGWGVLA